MAKIDTLLKKKGWTGAELGRLEIATVMNAYKRALNGEKDPKPAISKEDFNRLVKTLEDPAQGKIYNGYLAIHDWISRASVLAMSQEQQAQLRFNELATPIEVAYSAEQLYQYIAELPAIMTEKQYEETVKQRTKEILYDPDTNDFMYWSVFGAIEQAISYYVKLLHENPRKRNPLKPLRKKLERELVADPHILTRYNKVTGNGYYTLPDGRRSDQMSEEEWENASPEMREALKDPDGLEFSQERRLQVARDLYNGMTEEEAYTAHVQRYEEASFPQKLKWHLYEDPPKDLTKWEILEADNLYEYYPTLAGEAPEGEDFGTHADEEAKAFKEEFPEVAEAILKDMDSTLNGLIYDADGNAIKKKASSLSAEDWSAYFVVWEDFYKQGLYGFKEAFVGDAGIFGENRRAVFNGIAILRPSDLINRSKRIDANGYYSPPRIEPIIDSLSLLSYAPDRENYASLTSGLELARKTLIESVYWLTGFNTAVDLVADYYGVEELRIACVSTENLLSRMQAFNDLVASLYMRIKITDYEDEEAKAKKLAVLQDVFYPIDTTRFAIPEEKKKTVRGWLKDFKAFKDESKDICHYLCYEGVKS